MPFASSSPLRRRYRADKLRPVRIVELRQAAGAIEDEIVLQHHVPDGNAVLRDERQVAVRASDRKQADKTRIDLRRGEPVKMAVIPIRSLRHVFRDVIRVGIGHPGRDVQQHVVGIALRADVKAVDVKVQRR